MTDWRELARCRGYDSETFFDVPSSGERLLYAIGVCNACPVQNECREYALSDPVLCWSGTGIWGGLTASERKQILASRRRNRTAVRCYNQPENRVVPALRKQPGTVAAPVEEARHDRR